MQYFTCFNKRSTMATCSIIGLTVLQLFLSVRFAQADTRQLMFPSSEDSTDSREVSREVTAAPRLCPKGKWFHNETKSCWPRQSQGPCHKSMIFYPFDRNYGDCDCPEVIHNTAWVYDLASDQCFKTYQQAFCKTGEWLIFDKNNNLLCAPNKCEKLQSGNQNDDDSHPIVLFNNKCVRLMIGNGDGTCPGHGEVTINPRTGAPVCSNSSLDEYDIGVSGRLQCRTGTRRDRLGKCRPVNSKVKFRPSSPS